MVARCPKTATRSEPTAAASAACRPAGSWWYSASRSPSKKAPIDSGGPRRRPPPSDAGCRLKRFLQSHELCVVHTCF